VSSPDSRHSRNLARRAQVAITVFDSTVEVGQAEAVYFDADAQLVPADELASVLVALNARLLDAEQLSGDDLRRVARWSPTGPTCGAATCSCGEATASSATPPT
jgi:hypothetical protein